VMAMIGIIGMMAGGSGIIARGLFTPRATSSRSLPVR